MRLKPLEQAICLMAMKQMLEGEYEAAERVRRATEKNAPKVATPRRRR